MEAIRLSSFRSLGDTGFINLRPLTLLVGRNSFGKSSFLRFLPLLRQSVQTRTAGPIQWYGEYVDFGGFSETLSSFSEHDEMRFGFDFMLDSPALSSTHFDFDWPYLAGRGPRVSAEPIACRVVLSLALEQGDRRVARFRSITIEAAGHTITLDIELPDRLKAVIINGTCPLESVQEELALGSGLLLPTLHRSERSEKRVAAGRGYVVPFFRRPLAIRELAKELRPWFHHRTSRRKILRAAQSIRFGDEAAILENLRQHPERGVTWRRNVEQLRPSDSSFVAVRDLVVANWLGAVLEEVDREVGSFCAGVRYSKPVRATAERYYRQPDLAVEEVDAEGRNLAAFLSSLKGKQKRDFEEWTFRELGWKIVTGVTGGHLSVRMQERGGVEYNLADVGFGFSQVLPVVAQLWSMQRGGVKPGRGVNQMTFAIEQPELHLHPALQARLAEVMAGAAASAQQNEVRLRLVVETHSEAIVNRVGELIASKKLSHGDVAIVLFEAEAGTEGSEVRVAKFDGDGRLHDWPFGFFLPE